MSELRFGQPQPDIYRRYRRRALIARRVRALIAMGVLLEPVVVEEIEP